MSLGVCDYKFHSTLAFERSNSS